MNIEYNRNYFLHLAVQGTCAVIFMFLVLFSLDMVRAASLIWAAGASTLASSAYIVFGASHSDSSRPRRILIGYLIAMLCGHLIRLFTTYACSHAEFCQHAAYHTHVFELAAAISMGLSFLLMVLLRSSHPPAAGLAVVMLLDISNSKAMAVICIGAIVLALVKTLFRKTLKPLV